MEDGDDKIRRNLLVVSALVIVVWWLGLSPGELAERVVGVKGGSKVAAWRVWLLVLLLLGYLSLRYRFSESAAAAYGRMTSFWGEHLQGESMEAASRSVLAFLTGRSKRCVAAVRDPVPVDPIDEVNHDAPRSYSVDAAPGKVWDQGSVHFSVHAGRRAVRSEAARYSLTGWLRMKVLIKVGCRLLVYSPSSVELLLPSGIAFAAILVSVNQLAIALIGGMPG